MDTGRRDSMERCRKAFVVILALGFLVTFSLVPLVSAGEVKKININTASVEELMVLKWIGPKLAQRIVEYREKNGPFEKPEDIMLVSGIGPRAWEANKDRITVQ
jgi:competence protein ComEA